MTTRTRAATIATLVALAAPVARAAGPSVDDCIAADTSAQSLRRAGKLREAREQLMVCASSACPAMVKSDCTQRIDELDRVQPTIVFEVKNAAGQDVSDVFVWMDGKPLASKLTGTALAIDLGDHEFAFTAPRYLRYVQHFVIAEGQKDRRERVTLAAAPPATKPETTPATKPETAKPETTRPSMPEPVHREERTSASPLRAVGIATLAVGLVGMGVGAGFGFDAISKRDASGCQQNVCADQTAANLLIDAKGSATASTVLFVVGGVLAGGGALMGLLAPSRKVEVTPTVSVDSVGLVVRGVW